jgi:hypothetical protein
VVKFSRSDHQKVLTKSRRGNHETWKRRAAPRGPTAVALLFATLRSSPAAAEDDCPKGDLPVTGTAEGRATTVGFIVGARWGEGTLTLNDGSQHKFTGKGAKLIETGVAPFLACQEMH